MLLIGLDQIGSLRPEILEDFKKIQLWNNSPDGMKTVLFSVYALKNILSWYFTEYMGTGLPDSVRLWVESNSLPEGYPTEPSAEAAEPVQAEPEEDQEEGPEHGIDLIVDYRIPEYVRSFVNLNESLKISTNESERKIIMENINSIYDRFGLANEVERTLFYLLCFRMEQSKKPIRYNQFMESALKWSFSDSAKNVPNFPNTRTVLGTVFEDFLKKLKNRKLIVDREYEGYGRLIAIMQEGSAVDSLKKRDFDTIAGYIREDFRRSADDPDYPFPTLRSAQAFFKKNNINIDISLYCLKAADYTEIVDAVQGGSQDLKANFLSIKYINNTQDFILLTGDLYQSLAVEVSKKMYKFFTTIIPEKGNPSISGNILNLVNNQLRRNFPGDNLELNALLSPDRVYFNNLWTADDHFLNRWLYVFKELNDHILNFLKPGKNADLAIIQSVSILYQIIILRRKVQIKKEEKNLFSENLIKLFETNEKITREEIKALWTAKISRNGEDEPDFNEFLAAFLDEYSILKKRTDGFVIELPLINPKTKMLETSYLHSNNLLKVYDKIIDQITDKRFGSGKVRLSASFRRCSRTTGGVQIRRKSSTHWILIRALPFT